MLITFKLHHMYLYMHACTYLYRIIYITEYNSIYVNLHFCYVCCVFVYMCIKQSSVKWLQNFKSD